MKRIIITVALILAIQSGFAQNPEFHKDVAPIIHIKCTPCHKPGEAAPFSLITYEDVAKRAKFIKEVVQSGYMPPWKPDNKYVHFANERTLTDTEIKTIVQWVDNKTPQGSTVKLTSKQNSSIENPGYGRKPDLVLRQKSAYTIPGDNLERFIVYKIPFTLPDSVNIEGIEFTSNNKKLIHHANFAIHAAPDSIDIDTPVEMINLTEDDRSKFGQYASFRKSITYYGGWIPGTSYESYPKDFGWVLPKRGVMLLTVHYSPMAQNEETISGVNFYFTKQPIKRKVKVISFGSGGIGEQEIQPRFTYIPANKITTFTLKVRNPSDDQSVLYVWPHMHLIGKEFKAFAITPAQDTIKLVHIPEWDFRWQEIYRMKNLVRIPKGSIIQIEGTYDNTADNPFNPNNPPRGIYSFGDMNTNQEMMTMMMVFLPYEKGDETLKLEFEKESK